MKKIILILGVFFFMSNVVCADEEKQDFKHPYFYQRLTDVYDGTIYILKPDSKFFEISAPLAANEIGYGKVKCQLLENKEKFIKLRCNDCTDVTCKNYEEHINTFEILPYDGISDKHYIRHRVIDENNGSMLRENLLWLDGLIAIPPYQ